MRKPPSRVEFEFCYWISVATILIPIVMAAVTLFDLGR
jgi:hypothetical protein